MNGMAGRSPQLIRMYRALAGLAIVSASLFGQTVVQSHGRATEPQEPTSRAELSPDEERAVRQLVYGHELRIKTITDGPGLPERRLNIPDEIDVLYHKSPRGVLKCLLMIVKGANPHDATNAAAFALCAGSDRLPTYILFEDKKRYDQVDPKVGRTNRQYWIAVVERLIESLEKSQVISNR